MNKLQDEMLKLLTEFDTFCNCNHLNYHISYGTLLGAVRHKGFIPWDDDVDVIMPQEDYAKLIQLCSQINDEYFLQTIESDKSYFYLFAKFKYRNNIEVQTKEDILYKRNNCGVWIDVFPCVQCPSASTKIFKKWKRYRLFLSRILALKALPFTNASFKKKILKILSIGINRGFIVNLIKRSSYKFKKIEQPYLYIQDFWSSDEKQVVNNYDFNNRSFYLFEGKRLLGPKDYDTFLKWCYGDYMTPPPLEKRQGHL